MNENGNEVFRGHLEECLKHLEANLLPRGSKGAAQAKQPIADFCGIGVPTVSRWFRGFPPIGKQLIKLMFYLDMVGYRVIELERLPRTRRNFAELIGYGVLSVEAATSALGYSDMSSLYQVLHGHEGISDDKEKKMWDIWKAKKEELLLSKEEARRLWVRERSREDHSRPESSAERPAAILIMEGLLLLLDDPGEKIEEWGKSADTILRLSARLSSLSSNLIMRQKGGS